MNSAQGCFSCGRKHADIACADCQNFQFCSGQCAFDAAHIHNAVCFDAETKDLGHIEDHLENVILDMYMDVGAKAYESYEINDAIAVLDDLPYATDEAIELINDHLHDFAGQKVFDTLDKYDQRDIIGSEYASYGAFHRAHLGMERIAAMDADKTAARDALRAARAAERERKKRERALTLEERAKQRAERKRKRAKRRSERLNRMAARDDRRADRLRKRAEKRRLRATRATERGEKGAQQSETWGQRRANWANKSADRSGRRADRYRGKARADLSDSE